MNDTNRTVLIALGVALLIIILVPLLFMAGMMGATTGGMGRMMGGRAAWIMAGLVLLTLVAGIAIVAIGERRD